MNNFSFFNECFGGELLPAAAVRATDFSKVVGWFLLKRTVIGTNDRDAGPAVYISNLGIVIVVTVDRSGFFNEGIGREFFQACAVRATAFTMIVVNWCLLERTVIGANDRHLGFAVQIFNL